MRPRPAVEGDDLLARLVGGRPHVSVGIVGIEFWQRLVGTAEGVTEVPELDKGYVLYQAQQVGARRHQRAPDVVFGQAV